VNAGTLEIDGQTLQLSDVERAVLGARVTLSGAAAGHRPGGRVESVGAVHRFPPRD